MVDGKCPACGHNGFQPPCTHCGWRGPGEGWAGRDITARFTDYGSLMLEQGVYTQSGFGEVDFHGSRISIDPGDLERFKEWFRESTTGIIDIPRAASTSGDLPSGATTSALDVTAT